MIAADLDQDGRLDLGIVDAARRLSLYLGDGGGGITKTGEFGFATQVVATRVRDLDADGRIEVAAIAQTAPTLVMLEAQLPSIGGTAVPYGCGVNPAQRLAVLSGAPRLGKRLSLGADNPLGTQAAGALSILMFAAAPDVAFPCGTLVFGTGMAGGDGEFLLALTGPIVMLPGPTWGGVGTPAVFPLPIPVLPILVGLEVYFQAYLHDPMPAAPVPIGLTNGLNVTIGD